jgi:hypothetical protein
MKRALSGGAGADPDKEVSHSGTTGRTVGAWRRLTKNGQAEVRPAGSHHALINLEHREVDVLGN